MLLDPQFNATCPVGAIVLKSLVVARLQLTPIQQQEIGNREPLRAMIEPLLDKFERGHSLSFSQGDFEHQRGQPLANQAFPNEVQHFLQ